MRRGSRIRRWRTLAFPCREEEELVEDPEDKLPGNSEATWSGHGRRPLLSREGGAGGSRGPEHSAGAVTHVDPSGESDGE